jgi:hypothetical protein
MGDVRTDKEDGCPIRVGDSCSLCMPGARGPENCGLVYLVLSDPDLRAQLELRWIRAAAPPESP